MTDSFVVHLGGGRYLDASGNLTFGAPTGAQVYDKPAGFQIDSKKIQDALKDLSGILPHTDDEVKQWTEWGVSKKIVSCLRNYVAGPAAIMATAGATYMWAIGVAMNLLDVIGKADGLSPALESALLEIRSLLK